MQITIEHEVPGRMRVKLAGRVPDADLDALRRVLLSAPAIAAVSIYPRIGSVAVRYAAGEREGALAALRAVDAEAIDVARGSCEIALAPKTHGLLMDVATLVGGHVARRWFLPAPVRALCTLWGFRGFARAAARSLARARLDVPVLDAAAIGISLLQRDFKTAASTTRRNNMRRIRTKNFTENHHDI